MVDQIMGDRSIGVRISALQRPILSRIGSARKCCISALISPTGSSIIVIIRPPVTPIGGSEARTTGQTSGERNAEGYAHARDQILDMAFRTQRSREVGNFLEK
jgi:hypothetical protein